MVATASLSQINIARSSLLIFEIMHKDFMEDLIRILRKYKDNNFKYQRFSLAYRDLFRIICEREYMGFKSNPEKLSEMQKDVTNLKRMYINDFLDFQELIRNNDIGYNNIVRLIFGESAESISGKE